MVSFFKESMVRKEEEKNILSGFTRSRVLIVDDDHQSVLLVSRMMEALGSQIDAANGGVPALNCLSQSRYDVVITELEMPDLSGYDLACWIREKSPETRVIIMTGRSHVEVERHMNTGMVDHWIFKPFSLDDMEKVLNSIIPPDLQESHYSF